VAIAAAAAIPIGPEMLHHGYNISLYKQDLFLP
jgi:hypothetical protein